MDGVVALSIPQIVVTCVAAFGIPSAITGFLFKRLEKKLDQREKERQEKEKAREQSEFMMVKSIGAAIALGEATARAVQRIPDAKCNGDMHAALEYATSVKHEQKDFLIKRGIHDIY